MPITILSIEKSGSIKEHELKTYDEAQLYKKAGVKSAEGFELQTEWGAEVNNKKYSVSVYGKTNGRAGQENKYEFPPPIDNTLFFGACVLVNKQNGLPTSITKEEWKLVYDHLYGGFEDIGDEDSLEEDDDDESGPRTKSGYLKDGFVVDDDNCIDDEDEDDEEDEEDEDDDDDDDCDAEDDDDNNKKKMQKTKKIIKSKINLKKSKKSDKTLETIKKPLTLFEKLTTSKNDDTYLDCASELSEESYV